MPTCYWCKKLTPTWNQLYNDLSAAYRGNVLFYKVDGVSSSDISDRLDISGYPTIFKWQPFSYGVGDRYEGERDYDSLRKWIEDAAASVGFN